MSDQNMAQDIPLEEAGQPLEIPEGLTIEEIQTKATKWRSSWESFSSDMISNWEANRDMYYKFEKKTGNKVASKLPIIFQNIQIQLPKLVNAIFSRSEVVKPHAEQETDPNSILKIKNYVNKQMVVGSKAKKKTYDFITSILIYGIGYAKVFWDTTPGKKFVRTLPATPEFPAGQPIRKWMSVEKGQCNFQNISVFNFAIDPNYQGYDLQEAEWVSQRIYLSKFELKQMRENGSVGHFSDDDLVDSSKTNASSYRTPSKDKNKNYIDEYWASFEIDDENGLRAEDYYFWILNNKTLIKFKKNDYQRKPFISSRAYRMIDQFFSISEVDIMKVYAQQAGDVYTKAGLLGKVVGEKAFWYEPSSGFDAQRAQRTEGLVFPLDEGGLNKVKAEDTTAGQDLGVLVNWYKTILEQTQAGTGVNDVIAGEEGGDMTATEVRALVEAASSRLVTKVQNVQDEFIVELADQFYKLSQQFVFEHAFKYENTMYYLTEDDFDAEYEWTAIGSVTQANKNIRIMQLNELLDTAIKISQAAPMLKANGIDGVALLKGELLPQFEILDPDKYFMEEQAVPEVAPAEAALPEEINQIATGENTLQPPTEMDLESAATAIPV